MPKTLYTPREVARLLGISLAMVYKLANSGALDHTRVGDLFRFTADHLRAYLGLNVTADIIIPPERKQAEAPG